MHRHDTISHSASQRAVSCLSVVALSWPSLAFQPSEQASVCGGRCQSVDPPEEQERGSAASSAHGLTVKRLYWVFGRSLTQLQTLGWKTQPVTFEHFKVSLSNTALLGKKLEGRNKEYGYPHAQDDNPHWPGDTTVNQHAAQIQSNVLSMGHVTPGLFLQAQRGWQHGLSREKKYVYTFSHIKASAILSRTMPLWNMC